MKKNCAYVNSHKDIWASYHASIQTRGVHDDETTYTLQITSNYNFRL